MVRASRPVVAARATTERTMLNITKVVTSTPYDTERVSRFAHVRRRAETRETFSDEVQRLLAAAAPERRGHPPAERSQQCNRQQPGGGDQRHARGDGQHAAGVVGRPAEREGPWPALDGYGLRAAVDRDVDLAVVDLVVERAQAGLVARDRRL